MDKKYYKNWLFLSEEEVDCPTEEDIPEAAKQHVEAIETASDKSMDDTEKSFRQLVGKFRTHKPIGEFVNDPVPQLRAEFFNAIGKVVPEVLHSLAEELYLYYANAYYKKRPRKLTHLGRRKEDFLFLDSLYKWGEKWNLTPDWALNHAMDILAEWHRKPHTLGKMPTTITVFDSPFKLPLYTPLKEPDNDPLEKVYISLCQSLELLQKIYECNNLTEARKLAQQSAEKLKKATDYSLRWKDPQMETKSEFISRAKVTVDKHIANIEQTYKEAGWAEPLRKRNRSGDPNLHFNLLALYHLKSFNTYRQLADYYEEKYGIVMSENSIEKAVKNTAKSIGLLL